MPLVVPTTLTAQPVVPLVQVCRPDLRAAYPGDMDEAYYLRQAEQERKRLEGHQRKVTQADKAVAKASAAADKAALDELFRAAWLGGVGDEAAAGSAEGVVEPDAGGERE